jgi:hypothetical protein
VNYIITARGIGNFRLSATRADTDVSLLIKALRLDLQRKPVTQREVVVRTYKRAFAAKIPCVEDAGCITRFEVGKTVGLGGGGDCESSKEDGGDSVEIETHCEVSGTAVTFA